MTHEAYVKADDIYKKIENFRKLRQIASEPYKKLGLLKKFLWISNYNKIEVVLCDKELTKLIEEYCRKRIIELQKELNKL